MGDGDGYGGLPGAVPYAFRASESRLFRSYAVVGTVLALLLGVVFALGLVVTISRTLGTGGGTLTFSRAFVATVGLLVVFPLLAPVILVARRHRRVGGDARYDVAMAAAGYLYVVGLYLAVVISAPPGARSASPPAIIAPAVEFLYALPPLAGLVPPLVAVVAMAILHRRLR